MRCATISRTVLLVSFILGSSVSAISAQDDAEETKPLTLVKTVDDEPAYIDFFFLDKDCATCHVRQLQELQGSMHSAAHHEPLYRQFAELARKEAGDAIYTYCSGCHSAAGVVTELIPSTPEEDLPPEAKAGVTCNVCHQICELTHKQGPWDEPANASFALQQGRVMFGPTGDVTENRSHTGEKREFFSKSEFCASCHTVIHPVNGLKIENTYGEWKKSAYAENGIQCQDCHMRTVEDAVKVAETLKPVVVKGPMTQDGRIREIYPHYFVGGNANADVLADGKMHADMAEKRLQSAARLEVKLPETVAAGSKVQAEVIVHNVAAGHNLPTGVTELRHMWVQFKMIDAKGKTVFSSGELDDHGEITPDTIWFGAVCADASGKPTFKPWEMKTFLRQETIPPKGSCTTKLTAEIPSDVQGPLTVEADLFYRSIAPHIVKEVMKRDSFEPKIIKMTSTKATVRVD